VETERYREILGKELRVTDRQMKEQAIQKLKEFEEQRKNGPTELEAAMRYVRSQTNHSIRHTLGAIHVHACAYAGPAVLAVQPTSTSAHSRPRGVDFLDCAGSGERAESTVQPQPARSARVTTRNGVKTRIAI
jgi:hypothetical protein